MPNHNSITICGHLGRDAETKFIQSGHSVTTFSVATSIGTKEKPKTCWHNVKWWNAPELAIAELKKGLCVIVVGYIEQESWDDKKTGEKRTKDVITARICGPAWYTKKAERVDDGSAPPAAQSAFEVSDDDVPF
jgi:single-strand DNA-binding protein